MQRFKRNSEVIYQHSALSSLVPKVNFQFSGFGNSSGDGCRIAEKSPSLCMIQNIF